MPLIESSGFTPPWWLKNGHLQTVYAARLKKAPPVQYRREVFDTPDDDFVLLDWSTVGSSRLVIVIHGLGGNSQRPHVRGMVRAFNAAGWDALALNLRGAGGVPNRLLRTYHSGDTADLRSLIEHLDRRAGYEAIGLGGYSLGGNVILKYLGESAGNVPAVVRAAAVCSVPCDLEGCSAALDKWNNRLYRWNFIGPIKDLVRQKEARFPGTFDLGRLARIRTFQEIDNFYTAPVNGFADATDYYRKAGCLPFLSAIRVPTLLFSASDDSFLSESCFPVAIAASHPCLYFEKTKQGGHVGFVQAGAKDHSWSETRMADFLRHWL